MQSDNLIALDDCIVNHLNCKSMGSFAIGEDESAIGWEVPHSRDGPIGTDPVGGRKIDADGIR